MSGPPASSGSVHSTMRASPEPLTRVRQTVWSPMGSRSWPERPLALPGSEAMALQFDLNALCKRGQARVREQPVQRLFGIGLVAQ